MGAIADQVISSSADDLTIVEDLNSLFSDADGDILIFTATSDPIDVLSVTVNNNSLLVTALNAGETTIEVKADDGKGGVATLSFDLTVEEETVTALTDNIDGIKIYPNPVRDCLIVHFGENRIAKLDAVTLTDVSGRSMPFSASTQQGKMTLDVSALNAGIYLLTVNSKTHRIIKTQ